MTNVVSIPAAHPYVQAVAPPTVRFAPEPDPWWPHPLLDPARHPSDAEVMHIHFGFEHLSLVQTQNLVDNLRIPLVLTVHDLDNPHLRNQATYRKQLGILVAAAARVITLTTAAAEVIAQRYGRQAEVLPHPSLTAPQPVRAEAAGIGVFCKSWRTNVVPTPSFYSALATAADSPVTVYSHTDARVHPASLKVHEPMSDEQLHKAISSHAAVVLPYTHGTHSGWLELCRDLAVPVAVPDCGCYASQADRSEACATYPTGDGAAAGRVATKLARRGQIARKSNDFDVTGRHAEIYAEVTSA